ncbi:ABC transporter ABCC1-like protein [Leptotrombidium deliense]|uniref:ABC-type glutathione-S-conjugate transporter n=1 Tax=Leptotrombidium deliense TaxID=299467 RepID=A0A443SQ88_9ACAR|nr:ABC transporter ABCC1-like protein [Leptotrombidium deliense]
MYENEPLDVYTYFVSSLLKVLAFVIAFIIIVSHKSRGIPASGVLWIFCFIHLLCLIPTLTQLVLYDETFEDFEYYWSIIYFCSLSVLFLLLSFADLPPAKRKLLGDDEKEQESTRPPCPETTASFPSRLVFYWFTDLAIRGYKKPLVTDDIFDLCDEEKSENVVPVFDRNWKSTGQYTPSEYYFTEKLTSEETVRFEARKRNRSLLKTIFKCYGCDIFIAGIFLTTNCLLDLISPVLFKYLLQFMSSNEPTWHGILIASAMFSCNVLSNLGFNFYFSKVFKLQMRLQCALTNLIYKKSLTISSAAKKTSTSGEVVNLMAVDTQRMLDVTPYCLYIVALPIQIIMGIYLLYQQLGYSAFGGLLVMICSAPITYVSFKFARKYQVKQMKFKDERVKYLNETLNGMKVLKLYAWEPSFMKVINNIRIKEMNAFKVVAYLMAVTTFIWTFAPFLVALVSFAVYAYTGSDHVLNAEKIFVTLNLIDILRFPLSVLPMVISSTLMAYVSMKRIQDYLNATDLMPYVTRNNSDAAVEVKDGHFRWEVTENKSVANGTDGKVVETPVTNDTLSGINLRVEKGSLHAIVGQVGSGKSSLLSAVLGEMELVKGTVNVSGELKIAYVPQQAWIENLTLRNNIVFGKDYNSDQYELILDACALRPDLEILPAGDLTEIGEKGINLSGGQKQRVSLARACYSDADLYLFDDPLSAVDAHVAKHLFSRVLGSKKGLLKNKTRILVTNRLDILSKVDFVTVLKDGKISEQGTYNDLISKNGEFANFITQYSVSEKPKEENLSRQASVIENTEEPKKEKKKKDKLVEDETAEIGSVSLNVYRLYFKMISVVWCLVLLFGIGGFQVMSVVGNVWLSDWSSDNVTGNVETDNKQRNYRFVIYGAIGFAQTLCVIFGNFGLIKAGLQTAISLHSRLLFRIFRSKMSFFETTPLGRIVNRFSKDMDSVDTLLPQNFRDVLNRSFALLFAVCVITAQTTSFIAVLIPLAVAYYFIQKIFIPTSRQLQRLQSITRSPVYAQFSQTLQGTSTIRAYNASERFINESDRKVQHNLMCNFALLMGNRWLSVLLNTFGALIILFVGLFATFRRDSLTPGMVGLSLSYALTITQTLNWLVRNMTLVETNIVAVERINEYCENEMEAEWEIEDHKPPKNWPDRGSIEFKEYATRYREGLDLVLDNVSAVVNSSEKIGIVGRTGAGKSTITLSLFRIIEAAKGKITIDSLNIANLGLHDLRSKLTIIPQDPVLFSGTLRFNLDPFDAYSDSQIWTALEHSHLKQFVSGLEKGLSHEISEGGENLSVGQRQLVCLARALLRKSKILVLDEATAAVDMETDSLIQTTIKNEFANCTTLTIAHRIQTILECDRVMVIDKGNVIEFDSPHVLLSDSQSTFYALAKDAGILSQD